jgi:hypothetical protein
MITFFFKYNEIGGVQVLIYNLMKELHENNIRTKLIYYKESWLTRELDINGIKYDFFDIEEIRINRLDEFVHSDDILVTTILFLELANFKRINPFFFFWNVASFTFENTTKSFAWFRRLTRKHLVLKMIRKNGLVFMDNEGVQFLEKAFKININPSFLPVPIWISNENKYLLRRKSSIKKNIDITYIGRAIDLKINPVLKIIDDIKCCSESFRIALNIITDDIESFERSIDISGINFEIKFYSGLSGNELKQFLLANSDLHIAMGTSCLEGSSLGIPSVLIDASHKIFPEGYLYRWIFETEKFCLGRILEESDKITTGRPFSEILSYYDENRSDELARISEVCYEYTIQNHNLKYIANEFCDLCNNSSLKIRDVLYTDLGYYLPTMIRQIFKTFKYIFQSLFRSVS